MVALEDDRDLPYKSHNCDRVEMDDDDDDDDGFSSSPFIAEDETVVTKVIIDSSLYFSRILA
jgi:hypothetical protein